MNAADIVARIEQRLTDLNLSARGASLKAGLSSDAIRNWQRRLADDPESTGMTVDALRGIARALEVEFIWLLMGGDESPRAPNLGMAEDATPFTYANPTNADPIRALYADRARNAAITHRASATLPGFGITAGDLIVCDLARLPNPGEVAIAISFDTDHGAAQTFIRRYAPPYLLSGDELATQAIELTQAGMEARHPVVGVIRGT